MLERAKNRLLLTAIAAVLPAFAGHAAERDGHVVTEPYYGAALFRFYQQDYLPALISLETSQQFDRLGEHDTDAQLLKGGMLLSWGQHAEAGAIFADLLETSSDVATRDRANFYLGKIRYQRGYLSEAEQALSAISGELPAHELAEQQHLLARIYIAQERYAAAVEVLTSEAADSAWRNYALYNQGVALLRQNEFAAGITLLEQVGVSGAYDDEAAALRDRANLAIGFASLQNQQPEQARIALNRIRLDGPFATSAMLAAGWAATTEEDYRRALAPWQMLAERDELDNAVHESLLAVPYAYAQLDANSQAAEHYAKAIDVFDAEIASLEVALQDADQGHLLDALLQNEAAEVRGWNWQLAALPDEDHTRYLYFAIADHRFHEALKSYRALVSLQVYLDSWSQRLSPYVQVVEQRNQAHADKAAEMLARVAAYDLAGIQAQATELKSAALAAQNSKDSLAVAPAEQQLASKRLTEVAANSAMEAAEAEALGKRQRLMQGVMQWELERDYKLRVWQQNRELSELESELGLVTAEYERITANVEAMPARNAELLQRISTAKNELGAVQAELDELLQAYRDYLNGVAHAELQVQRERIQDYRAQARFSLATLYDRMSAGTE